MFLLLAERFMLSQKLVVLGKKYLMAENSSLTSDCCKSCLCVYICQQSQGTSSTFNFPLFFFSFSSQTDLPDQIILPSFSSLCLSKHERRHISSILLSLSGWGVGTRLLRSLLTQTIMWLKGFSLIHSTGHQVEPQEFSYLFLAFSSLIPAERVGVFN